MENTIDFIDDKKRKELENQEVLEKEDALDEELDEALEKAYNTTAEFNEEMEDCCPVHGAGLPVHRCLGHAGLLHRPGDGP